MTTKERVAAIVDLTILWEAAVRNNDDVIVLKVRSKILELLEQV